MVSGPNTPRRPVSTDDYVALMRLVHRYADAVVHRDAAQWAGCWTEDAAWDLGGGRLVEGRDAIVGLWNAAMGSIPAVVQQVYSGDAWYDADATDRAVGRWAIGERLRTATDARQLMLAHYDDAYRKDAGEWLFTRRFLQVHYSGPADLSGTFLNDRAGLEARGLSPDV